jgi:hypothetical protein
MELIITRNLQSVVEHRICKARSPVGYRRQVQILQYKDVMIDVCKYV